MKFDEYVFPYGSMTPNSPPSNEFLENIDDSNFISSIFRQTSIVFEVPHFPSTTSSETSSPSSSSSENLSSSDNSAPLFTIDSDPTVLRSLVSSLPNFHHQVPITSTHPVFTRSRLGTVKPVQKLNLHVESSSPIPYKYLQAFKDPNWSNAMKDEYNALIVN